MGSSFVLLDVSMEITLGQLRLDTKMSLPMGKKASVTTTILIKVYHTSMRLPHFQATFQQKNRLISSSYLTHERVRYS